MVIGIAKGHFKKAMNRSQRWVWYVANIDYHSLMVSLNMRYHPRTKRILRTVCFALLCITPMTFPPATSTDEAEQVRETLVSVWALARHVLLAFGGWVGKGKGERDPI